MRRLFKARRDMAGNLPQMSGVLTTCRCLSSGPLLTVFTS
jgi:hypothetical protein